jgi:hypothetical protein
MWAPTKATLPEQPTFSSSYKMPTAVDLFNTVIDLVESSGDQQMLSHNNISVCEQRKVGNFTVNSYWVQASKFT